MHRGKGQWNLERLFLSSKKGAGRFPKDYLRDFPLRSYRLLYIWHLITFRIEVKYVESINYEYDTPCSIANPMFWAWSGSDVAMRSSCSPIIMVL